MKKPTLFLLSCAALTLCLCATAFAEDVIYAANGGKIHFDNVSGTVMDCEKTVIKIALPSEIKGAPVLSIAENAFADCDKLTSVKFSDGLSSVGDGAFSGCVKLESAQLPDGVTYIGAAAFADCAALESFRIPDGVVSVGEEAFRGCAALRELSVPESTRSIGLRAFDNCAKLTGFSVNGGNAYYSASDGVLFDRAGTRLVRYPEGKAAASYAIPEGVVYVGAGAFRNCGKLKEAIIPNGVISIEDFAFFGCAKLSDVRIPDGVKAVGAGAFSFSGLESVIIPDSVVSVGALAFEPCENLRDVYYAGSREQWGRMEQWEEAEGLERRELVPDGVTVRYNYNGVKDALQILSAPLANGHAIRAADLQGLKEITVPLSVRAVAQITLIAPFYDADGRFLGVGFATQAVDESVTSVTAPVAGDVSGAASVKVTLCAASRPVVRAESYSIAP